MAIPAHRKPDKGARLNALLAVRSLRHKRAWLFQAYMLLLALTFGVLAFFVSTTPYFGFDLAFTRALQAISLPGFDWLMRAVSLLGFDWKAILAISLITLYLFSIGLRWEAVVGVIGSTGIWVLDNLVKVVVDRPRPSPDLVHVITQLNGPSFTSGHVTSFVVFYGFQWFLAYTLLKPSWKRTLLLALLGILILLAGLSRIYSGEHWPSDVLGSYLLGSLWLALIIQLYRWGRGHRLVRRLLHEEWRMYEKSLAQ